jgi:hypothetical protein
VEKNRRRLATAKNSLRWMARLLVWVLLLASIYIGHYVYFSRVPFDSAPNFFTIFVFTAFFAGAVYLSVRRSSLVGIVVGVGLMYLSVDTSFFWNDRWQRIKFLHENYVNNFTYDKYCNLSGEDKMLMEEISIYGITDCDDAKIPYKKQPTIGVKKSP